VIVVGGKPYWTGVQLDETALPVLLAALLAERDALAGTEVEDMVRRALSYIVRNGPSSEQDRWEETAGLNTFTLAACIAALVGGALASGGAMSKATRDQFAEDVYDQRLLEQDALSPVNWPGSSRWTYSRRISFRRRSSQKCPLKTPSLESPLPAVRRMQFFIFWPLREKQGFPSPIYALVEPNFWWKLIRLQIEMHLGLVCAALLNEP